MMTLVVMDLILQGQRSDFDYESEVRACCFGWRRSQIQSLLSLDQRILNRKAWKEFSGLEPPVTIDNIGLNKQ